LQEINGNGKQKLKGEVIEMTIKIDRSKVGVLTRALIAIQFHYLDEAREAKDEAHRMSAESTAKMYEDLYKEIKAQRDAWDAKHPPKV
jgi:hypothetical protein